MNHVLQAASGLIQRLMQRRPAVLLGACFIAVAAIYFLSPMVTSADSRWSLHTAHSLLHGNAGRLDDYREALKRHENYGIETIGGHPRTFFSMGVSFLAMPFVAVMSVVDPKFESTLKRGIPLRSEKLIASVYAALAVVLFCWLIWIVFDDGLLTLAGLVVFAFATPMWSLACLGLWQHGPAILMFVIAMLLLVGGGRRPELVRYASLPLAAAFVIRPTAIVEVVVFSAYVLLVQQREFVKFVAWSLPIALGWFALNLSIYGYPVPAYYFVSRLGSTTFAGWLEGLAGLLISPGRGLFVYSPIFLLAGVGAVQAWRDTERRWLHAAFITCIFLHWLLTASNNTWDGGQTYGPRLMSDVTPFLAYFSVWGIKRLLEIDARWPAAAIAILLSLSIAQHSRGAWSWSVHEWNIKSLDGSDPDVPARMWDWSDPPFLRGIVHR